MAGSVDGCPDKREAGADWKPGMPAAHKSLSAFQKELEDRHGIRLPTSKIRKLLISGGGWTTKRSREVWGQQTGKLQQKRGKVYAIPEKEMSDNMIKFDQ